MKTRIDPNGMTTVRLAWPVLPAPSVAISDDEPGVGEGDHVGDGEIGALIDDGLGADGGPRGLDQGGFQPRGAWAHAGGESLAGTLVQPGTQAGPGDEMPRGRESAQVGPDLGHERLPLAPQQFDLTHAGDGDQAVDDGAKGRERDLQARVQFLHRRLQRGDLRQVQLQHEAVMGRHAPLQGGDQLGPGGLEPSTRERRQPRRQGSPPAPKLSRGCAEGRDWR